MAFSSAVLSTTVAVMALMASFVSADVPECVVLLCTPHERADMWLQGAQSEAIRLYHSIFGGWLPSSCRPKAPRHRVPGCIDDEMLASHVSIVRGAVHEETCQYKGCNFTRFFPTGDSKPAREWLAQAEALLDRAWDIVEAIHLGQCVDDDEFTYEEVIQLSCAAEHIYATVHTTLALGSPWRNKKFTFRHYLSAPVFRSLYETDNMPAPPGDENDLVHRQRSIESYMGCCSASSDGDKSMELQAVHLKVDANARGRASSAQQLLWVVSAPVSPFGPECENKASNIHDTDHTAYSGVYGHGDTTSVTNPEIGVAFPGETITDFMHPDTSVLAESTDVFWPEGNAGQLINVAKDLKFAVPQKRRAFAFFSVRTPGIPPQHLHGADDDDDDYLVARTVVRERDPANNNCRDYDASCQVPVDMCVNATWPCEGIPVGPVLSLQQSESAHCVGGVRQGEPCDPSLSGVQQCTATGACLKTKVSIFGGAHSIEEYVCHDWPKPGPNTAYPCKPSALACPYGTCFDGNGAYPLYGVDGANWYAHPDTSAVVSMRV